MSRQRKRGRDEAADIANRLLTWAFIAVAVGAVVGAVLWSLHP